jgi:hypothetical protein
MSLFGDDSSEKDRSKFSLYHYRDGSEHGGEWKYVAGSGIHSVMQWLQKQAITPKHIERCGDVYVTVLGDES